ncbi:hypothetical protein LOTGIDRAFT_157984 [Lottia gigantea]|uniref:Uncharacterized protein n=1 Tax=Lottia gigantea TaxID=225164 RepID=V4A9M5_LOTGI|nr:hypothetical protein LOTGIDRAFT_157984 [Lottia gigantea]ESP00694.1 hypothetical protein LOTGIDRAFT_157984 [Lottia gigantea]
MSKSKVSKHQILEELQIGMAVRNTVRNMAYNLENVITNLHGIVGDLHVLVTQIDSVADKIDRPIKNGFKKPENGLRYMLTPINGSSESVSSKGVVSNNIQHWQDLIETCENQEFSPDLDWSYLGLSEDSKAPSFQQPSKPQLQCSIFNDSACFPASTSLLEPCQITTSTDIDTDSICSLIVVPYDGSYEKAVDDVLENLDGEDDESDFSDTETSSDALTASYTSSTHSNESSVSSIEYQAVYNRHMNPWTCYSSVVNPLDPVDIGSCTLDSKDSFNVDDILNDNYLESKYFAHRLDENISNVVIFNQ